MPLPSFIRNVLNRSPKSADFAAVDQAPGAQLPASLDDNPLAALGQLELISRRMADGLLSGKHRSTHRGGSTDFTEHRPYAPGDDTRMIDWRLHARNDRYHIKQYEDETNLKAILAVDASGSMAFDGRRRDGQPAASKFDTARIVAACLARLLMRQRDAVGMSIVGETLGGFLPPRVRADSVRQMNQLLSEATLQGKSNVGECLTELAGRNRSRGMLILFSDCFCDLSQLKRGLLSWGQAGHDILVVEVIAADEEDFAFRQSVVLEDLEHPGHKLEIDPGNVRAVYLERLRKHRVQLKQLVTSCRGQLISIRNDEPIGEALKRFLPVSSIEGWRRFGAEGWSMSWLAPFFLTALPILALPIFLHLWKKRRRETLPWGAMQFLVSQTQQQRRSPISIAGWCCWHAA